VDCRLGNESTRESLSPQSDKRPNDAELLSLVGSSAALAGKPGEAVDPYKTALAGINSRSSEAADIYCIGEVYRQQAIAPAVSRGCKRPQKPVPPGNPICGRRWQATKVMSSTGKHHCLRFAQPALGCLAFTALFHASAQTGRNGSDY
jgi:hypothetical protein